MLCLSIVASLAIGPLAFPVRAFAEAWTPCVGPLDANNENAGQLIIAHHALRQQLVEAQQVRYSTVDALLANALPSCLCSWSQLYKSVASAGG